MADEKKPKQTRGWLRVVITIVCCILALVGGGMVFQALASLKEKPQQSEVEEKVYKVDVFKTEQIPLGEVISGFGTSRAYREVVLSAEVGGRVVEKHPSLKPGANVVASQVEVDSQGRTRSTTPSLPLVRIDPETYKQRVVQASGRIAEIDAELKVLAEQEANNERLIKKAAADVEVYQSEYQRIEDLGKRGVISKTELTTARLELERYKQSVLNLDNETRLFPVRQLQLERKRATAVSDLETAQLDLARTEIRPPFSGALSEVMVEVGQNLRPGDPLVKLLDLDVIEVPVPLALGDYEKVAALLKAGDNPTVTLARNTTSPGQWTGIIERVSPQADESTRTVEVYIRVENADQPIPLLPGTFVNARIQGPVIPSAIAIPRDCITDGTVYVADDGRAVKRRIVRGQTLQSLVLIDEGLEAGDQVILTNLDILDDRAKVDVQQIRTLADELELMEVPLVVPKVAEQERVPQDGASQ
ncbi:Multidrug resistance protein MdtA precursor [Symmachiella macrocystis]|uniref:Multidrug resistance protein MdtA n=1 Tax=Symmachiella macrocystis TaxID=2527985 RepID=A0A5C6BNP1_9PLAN|nr:efflux RND transporter periplasmic adaptor subunit [Symmachiella macrocystis]TWU13780.1 Multidrug resistance protein MdtA precursor [Symmachiella macrocystis]